MKKKTSFLLPAIVALGALATLRADADTILASFDLNRSSPLMSGDPILDTDGLQLTGKIGDWVNVTAAALTPDGTDSSSGTNTVTLDFIQLEVGIQSFNRTTQPDPLRRDCFYLTNADALFTIKLGGLNPLTAYQVVFYGQREFDAPSNPSDIWFGTGAGTGVALDSEYDANFASVTTDAFGDLAFTWAVPDGNTLAAFSGIQVATITEPSSATTVEAVGFDGAGDFLINAFQLDPAKTYELKRSTDLQEFSSLTPKVIIDGSNGAQQQIKDENPPVGKALYRLQEE
jgi:hypothetical protein